MPILQSQFVIDLVDLNHSKRPTEVIEAFTSTAAKALGKKIVELIPYTVEPYPNHNAVPDVAFTRDHEFKDRYRLELHIMKSEDYYKIAKLVKKLMNNVHLDEEDKETLKQFYNL